MCLAKAPELSYASVLSDMAVVESVKKVTEGPELGRSLTAEGCTENRGMLAAF